MLFKRKDRPSAERGEEKSLYPMLHIARSLKEYQQELAKKGDSLSYDGLNLTLLSGERPLSSVPVAGGGGAVVYHFGHGLRQDGLHVWVDAVDDFHGDNTLPMTAAGVYAAVGNIEALLGAI